MYRELKKEICILLLATAACVFDVFNIFMLIVAVIWLVIWAWS